MVSPALVISPQQQIKTVISYLFKAKHSQNYSSQQAPTAPNKRKPLRLKATERLSNPHAPRKVFRPNAAVTDSFLESKADKRLIKHASFVSRITKPTSENSKASRKNAKRREKKRLAEKVLGKMDSLADALPDLTAEEVQTGAEEKEGKLRHKSLKSKPGALKKKERVVRGEMERFGVSLAQLASVKEDTAPATTATSGDVKMEGAEVEVQQKSAAANRFAALRGFISATMMQNPAFAPREGTS